MRRAFIILDIAVLGLAALAGASLTREWPLVGLAAVLTMVGFALLGWQSTQSEPRVSVVFASARTVLALLFALPVVALYGTFMLPAWIFTGGVVYFALAVRRWREEVEKRPHLRG